METSTIKNEVLDFLKDIVIIIVVVFFVKTFFISPFQIKGQSMYDSYYDGQFIIVDRFSYLSVSDIKKWLPERWDVVVFRPGVNDEKEFYIKRIIGVPGDSIKIDEGKVFLKIEWQSDFAELDEVYLSDWNMESTFVSGKSKENTYKVPEGGYFVMWDNRVASTDSRSCFSYCSGDTSNFVPKEAIVWKLLLDLWYFNFKEFSFTHPKLGISTFPTFFSSPSHFDYEN